MCGFLCVTNTSNFKNENLISSLNLLNHRGPDNSQSYTDKKNSLFLGFNRLSIQDTSDNGNQPMMDKDKNIIIVFNGEIYNFRKLKSKLLNDVDQLISKSDTEVILNLYKKYGINELLKLIKGMFSIIIYDKILNELILIRDQFGMKPLYYSYYDTSFVISSEIKSIIHLRNKNDFDSKYCFNTSLTCYLPPKGKTMFSDIKEVKPGSYVIIDLNKNTIKEKTFVNILDIVDKNKYLYNSNISSRNYISKFIEILENSVDEHLISDTKIGVLYSGGLDSSIISKIASNLKGNIDLFHFSAENDIHKDNKFVENFSKTSGNNLHIIEENEIDFKKEFVDMLYYYEFPNKPEGIVLNKVCSYASRLGFKSLLTGDCADELLGGYEIHKDFLLRYKSSKSRLIKFINKFVNFFSNYDLYEITRYDPTQTDYFIQPSIKNLFEIPANLLLHRGLRTNEFISSIKQYDFLNSDYEKKMQGFILDNINFAMQRYLKRSDAIGMKNSIELRIPFLDYDLFNLILNSPLKYKLSNPIFSFYERKKILKKIALKLDIPKEIINRKKVGTHFNFVSDLLDILKKIEFVHSSKILNIDKKIIKDNLLNSLGSESQRAIYGLISTEILGMIFLDKLNKKEIYEVIK